MVYLKLFLILFVTGLLIDFVWIGLIAKNFYLSQLGNLARLKSGKFDAILWAALLVYACIALGIVFYVLPQVGDDTGWFLTFLAGAFFGLIMYGLYDLTNLATLAKWPRLYCFVDMLWGSFLCGTLTTLGSWVRGFVQ